MEHISDHDLERYQLGMVSKGSEEEAELEEHLLWCGECLARAPTSETKGALALCAPIFVPRVRSENGPVLVSGPLSERTFFDTCY